MKRKMLWILIVVLVAGLVCVACSDKGQSGNGDPQGNNSDGDKVLKVAVCAPITGESAKQGNSFKIATEMAFEDIGYKIGDYKIELVLVDCTTDPEKGALALEQAIVKDGVQVALHNWYTSVAMSMMDTAAKYEIPYFFSNGAGSTIDDKWQSNPEKYSYYIGKGWPKTDFLAGVYVDLLNNVVADGTWVPRNMDIAIFGDDTDWGRSVASSLITSFEGGGWTTVHEDYFASGATDLYAFLSKIKASGASLVAGTISSPASASALIKQARELDIQALIICDGLSENGDWYQLCGEAANYVLDCRAVFYTDEGFEFAKRFAEKAGYNAAAPCEGVAWDHTNNFIQVCRETLETYGELTTESLYKFGVEYVMTGNYEFTDGVTQNCFKWTPETAPSPVVGEDYFYASILQFVDGEMISVWPESRKLGEFVVPDYAK